MNVGSLSPPLPAASRSEIGGSALAHGTLAAMRRFCSPSPRSAFGYAFLTSCILMLTACAQGGSDRRPADGGTGNIDGEVFDGHVIDSQVPDSQVPDMPRPDLGPGGDAGSCMEGAPCDADGDGCTQDVCRRGVCVFGPVNACDDGENCTSDTCSSTGPMAFECTHAVAGGGCLIDSMCRTSSQPNPDNACQVCDAAASSSQWTTLVGACDDGNVCTTNDTCASGVCTGTATLDAFESNNTRAMAHRLPTIRDNATFPAGTLMGSLFPDGDEDWYVFTDQDRFGGFIYPKAALENIPTGTDYELCAYISCTEGSTTSASCTAGTRSTFETLPGCCSNAAGNANETVRINPECSGSDDSVDLFVVVRQVGGEPTCSASYTLKHGDD